MSAKVADGFWGDGTVDELASYIAVKMPGIGGFNRRGLYRMKQFHDTYSISSDCFKYWLDIQTAGKQISFVSPMATQITPPKGSGTEIVSPMATQLENPEKEHSKFVSSLLTQITWTNHMEILSGGKSEEEKLFYLLITAKEKLSKLDLRRQIKTATFERTMLANQKGLAVQTLFPKGIFKDPYIFEFLDLPDTHSENDLEKALIKNLQKFILEALDRDVKRPYENPRLAFCCVKSKTAK